MRPAASVLIRSFREVDLPQMHDIEQAVSADPWEAKLLRMTLADKHIGAYVADWAAAGPSIASCLSGFVIYENHKSRLEIINCAVLHNTRRCGIGTALVNAVQDRARGIKQTKPIEYLVSDENFRGFAFLRSLGFRAVGIEWGARDDLYTGEPRDSYRFEYREPVRQPTTLAKARGR